MSRRRFRSSPNGGSSTALVVGAGAILVVILGGVLWAAQRPKPVAQSAPRPAASQPPAPAPKVTQAQPAPKVEAPQSGQDQSPPQEKPKSETPKAEETKPAVAKAEEPKPAAEAAANAEYKLVWSDEFDKDGAPDAAKWTYEVGFVRNGELQYYTKDRRENARIENGCLIIEGRKERFPNPSYKAGAKGGWNQTKEFADYTAASLTTQGIAQWTYGRIEVRAKLPAGRGTWPAIWMLGTNIGRVGWPRCGEIDIMEYVGFDPNGVHTTVHTAKYNHTKGTQKGHRETSTAKPSEDFHIYAIEWDAKKIDFYYDQKKVFSFADDGGGEDAWPFNHDHYLLLNFAIGGGWGGAKGIDESIWPQKYFIDYVRVYQRP